MATTVAAHDLSDPGAQDITTEVAIDQLAAAVGVPDAVRTQAQFLQRWGIDELVAEGRSYLGVTGGATPARGDAGPGVRGREAEALLDPTGLGGFMVMEWAR